MALLVIAVVALGRFLAFLWTLWKSGDPHPIASTITAFPTASKEFVPIAVGVFAIGAFLVSLSYIKSMITAIVPFWADAPLAASDQLLYIHPQAMAEAIRPALPALGFFYGLWHIVHLGGILWVLHWRTNDKSRHILSFMLTWSIGMALAYVFSSAGPLFTGVYDPLIAPESVRKPAQFLWANYQAQGALIGGGISAFPSMHVGLAAWFALALKDKGLPLTGIIYVLAIYFCSVVLGWHYAVDGAAGIGVALIGDMLSRRWLGRAGKQLRPANAVVGETLPIC